MKARIGILLSALILAACQTAPKPAPSPSPSPEPSPSPAPTAAPASDASTVSVSADGFSPLADAPHNTITFGLHIAAADTLTSWTLAVSGPDGVVRTASGDKAVPQWTWDGATDGPKLTDALYHATLTVAHGDKKETVDSSPFHVDVTPPSGMVTVTPQPFTLNAEDGGNVTFLLDLKQGGAALSTWRLLVMHPDGRQFTSFINQNYADNRVVWNGRDASGNTLETGVTYNIVVQVVDLYGNKGTLNAKMPVTAAAVTAPVTVSIDGNLIAQLQVHFPAYSADLNQVDAANAQRNKAALDKLAALLKAAPKAKIRVVGHANQVLWQDPVKAKYEQTETLIPLSKARAEAVLAALKARGLDAGQFDVTGVGAEGNVVPFSDAPNVWKNRRVEFLLGK